MALQRVGSLVSLGIMAALALTLSCRAGEAAVSREKVRLELLDTCVVDQWKKRQKKDRIVNECQCVASSVSAKFSGEEIAAFEEELSRAQRSLWDAATKACFK